MHSYIWYKKIETLYTSSILINFSWELCVIWTTAEFLSVRYTDKHLFHCHSEQTLCCHYHSELKVACLNLKLQLLANYCEWSEPTYSFCKGLVFYTLYILYMCPNFMWKIHKILPRWITFTCQQWLHSSSILLVRDLISLTSYTSGCSCECGSETVCIPCLL